jgi:hypothetical protein
MTREPLPKHQAPPAEQTYDGRPELRAIIHERLGFIQAHAQVGQIEAEAGQDSALAHAVRRLVIQTKAAVDVVNMLTAERKRLTGESAADAA